MNTKVEEAKKIRNSLIRQNLRLFHEIQRLTSKDHRVIDKIEETLGENYNMSLKNRSISLENGILSFNGKKMDENARNFLKNKKEINQNTERVDEDTKKSSEILKDLKSKLKTYQENNNRIKELEKTIAAEKPAKISARNL